jgi:hypothetical protein
MIVVPSDLLARFESTLSQNASKIVRLPQLRAEAQHYDVQARSLRPVHHAVQGFGGSQWQREIMTQSVEEG